MVEGFGSTIVSLVTVKFCQIIEAGGDRGVKLSQGGFSDFQGAEVERFGGIIVSLVLVE